MVLWPINWLLTRIFDWILLPFGELPPVWPLLFIAAATGLVMAWVFARVSDQQAIIPIKARIRGHLLGVYLFRHDPGVVFSLQGRVLRETATYLKHSCIPIAVLLIPVTLILVQASVRLSERPLQPGEAAVFKVEVDDLAGSQPELRSNGGIEVETPPVRVMERNEAAWRIRAVKAGRHLLRVEFGGQVEEKEVRVGGGWTALSSLRSSSWLDSLGNPVEKPLNSDSHFRSIAVSLPPLEIRALGWSLDWLWTFVAVSILTALICGRMLGIQF